MIILPEEHRLVYQWNSIENPEINCHNSHLIFDKTARKIHKRRSILFNKWWNETQTSLIYIICKKIYSKFIYMMDLNIRLKTIKTDGEKQVKHPD